MESVSRARKESPSITEESPVTCSASGFRGKIRNNDDIEFQTFRLMNGKEADNIIVLGNNLCLRLANGWIVGPVAKIANDVVQGGCALTAKLPRDLDQFPDIRHPLRSILLGHHDGVEIGLADDVLK